MFLNHASAQPAELVLAAFEPMAAFFMFGAALMIAAIVWAVLSPDLPDEGNESGDDLDVKATKR